MEKIEFVKINGKDVAFVDDKPPLREPLDDSTSIFHLLCMSPITYIVPEKLKRFVESLPDDTRWGI